MDSFDEFIGGHDTIAPATAPATSPVPDRFINTVLEERYLIERKLGQGGFGTVYLGSDNKIVSRKIVVKIMHRDGLTNDWRKKKFLQELEALGRINHPSVVGVLDYGETSDGCPYLIMQYVEGVSLRSLLTSDGMSFGRVANLIKQIGKALSAAHQAGILHRDLKPENLMVQTVDDDEYVKVIDFGVAKVRNSLVDVSTTKDVAVGTIVYMSPEQLSAQTLTPASDVYALGVIAYEMLTGKRPINPASAYQLLEMQRSGVRVKPSDLRPGLTAKAEEVILKALSFNPEDRFQRASDFGNYLSSALLQDDEETLPSPRKNEMIDTPSSNEPTLETAHVLFVDLVGYSRLVLDEQARQLRQLQQFVSATAECQRAQNKNELIALPTGDGMALVFMSDPEAPVRCAVELSRALKATPEIKLRMGVHSGLVYRMADIKNNMNVAGGGINIAQRVMDCGDAGHILLSKRVADDVGQLARWSGYLHDLSTAEVKHGVVVHVFNLYGEDFGNAEVPLKFRKTEVPRPKNAAIIFVATVLLLTAAAAFLYRYTRPPAPAPSYNNNQTASAPAATGPFRSLTYWLTYQKMRNGKPDSDIRQSAGNDIFGNGWRFQFNLMPNESGALYLLDVGPGKDGAQEYNILFPLPGVGLPNANLGASQAFKSDWARFVDKTGVERIWIIWSAKQIPQLDEIFKHAASNAGVIANSGEIEKVNQFLNPANANVVHDKEKKQTFVSATGDILVSVVELTHEAN